MRDPIHEHERDEPFGFHGASLVAWTVVACAAGVAIAFGVSAFLTLRAQRQLERDVHDDVSRLDASIVALDARVTALEHAPAPRVDRVDPIVAPTSGAPTIEHVTPPPPPPPPPAPRSTERDDRVESDEHASGCPSGYVNAGGFCIAQFEMKNVNGVATSTAAGEPWTTTRDDAIAKCAALGDGYHLVTNGEWQAVAHAVELVGANWSGGAPGKGVMNAGNFDAAHGAADPSDPCATPGFTTTHAHCLDRASSDFARKRTHALPSGDVIWDLGGNVAEWTSTSTGPDAPDSGYQRACSAEGAARTAYGPLGNYQCGSDDDPLNFGCFEGGGGRVVYRGGSWGTEGSAWSGCHGIFTVNTNAFWTSTRTGPGFRCVYRP